MKNRTLSLCITCYDGDYHLLDTLLNEVKKQTVAPNELIISSFARSCPPPKPLSGFHQHLKTLSVSK
eukprot:COSAG05_NODE_8715_length_678_cov_0.753022_2_plen_66_part_01